MRVMLLSVITCLVVVSGCASTEVTGFKDPAFQNVTYHRVVVMARSGDLIHDQSAEERFVRCLSKRGVLAHPSADFFPPTREITQQEAIQRLSDEEVGALLLITLERWWKDTVFVDGTSGDRPRAKYSMQLLDTKSGAVAWKASTFTAGDELADMGTLLSSLASKTTSALVEAGLVCPVE